MAGKQRPSTKTTSRATAKKTSAKATGERASTQAKRKSSTEGASKASAQAATVDSELSVTDIGDELISGKKTAATRAARAIEALLEQDPEAIVPIIDRLVKAIGGEEKRTAQTAATALPVMARIAPARVARHLQLLKDSFETATPVGKDGLVRTFAALCTASVAYQRRLEGVLNQALTEADAKTLPKWTEVVLPALKGEPHARARATVEARLDRIPKNVAQKIADFLGIKLRLRYR